jgi:hypothetical protein
MVMLKECKTKECQNIFQPLQWKEKVRQKRLHRRDETEDITKDGIRPNKIQI